MIDDCEPMHMDTIQVEIVPYEPPQSHYIESPKDYVGGLATDPPPAKRDYKIGQNDGNDDISIFTCSSNDFIDNEIEITDHITEYDNIGDEVVLESYESLGHSVAGHKLYDENAASPTIATINTINARNDYFDIIQEDSCPDYAYDTQDESDDSDSEDAFSRDFINFVNEKRIYVDTYIEYPTNLDKQATAGSYHPSNNTFTNACIQRSRVEQKDDYFENHIPLEIDSSQHGILRNIFSDSTAKVVNQGNVSLHNKYFVDDEVEEIYDEEVVYIHSTNDQWYINVPIKFDNATIEETAIFADPGANAACIDYDYAFHYFYDSICNNNTNITMKTPGGIVKPKYCLWMSFPTTTGTILKAKLYLVKNLPVKILADINMLKAFGYKFHNETPPVFRHDSKIELDLELPDEDDILSNRGKNYKNYNWFKSRIKSKHNQLQINQAARIPDKDKLCIFDVLKGDDTVLHDQTDGVECDVNIISNEIDNYNMIDVFEDENDDKYYNIETIDDVQFLVPTAQSLNEMLNTSTINYEYTYEVDHHRASLNTMLSFINNEKSEFINNYGSDKYNYHELRDANGFPFSGTTIYYKMDKFGNSYGNAPIYHRCMFILSRQSFQATPDELAEADVTREEKDKVLQFKNLDYLKQYEFKYGRMYAGLYQSVMAWINRNREIFATHTFSRKTMTVPYARLGIKEEHRNKTMYAPQYPINREKRIDMINYTIKNRENGFWEPIQHSLNCVPYTMVPKKKDGIVIRYRPAFDGRVVNQWCELMMSNMPTLKDFRDLHSIKGLTTMCDVKNCFDCIPLHPDDRKYAVAHTPLGLYRMNCLTYGWMNAAPEAQKIMNQVALHIGNALAYIDDICIKHTFDEGTRGVILQLDRLAEICRKFNIQLNPSKFAPACDYSESFGFQNSMIGEMMSAAYQRKLLAMKKPMTKAEARSVDGMLNYMNNHIYKNKLLMYWINILEEETEVGSKRKRLKWTPQAELAWLQIKWLIGNLPLLHHPTKDGQFCVQTDACNYGVGAVLWQSQYNEEKKEEEWVIVDMWSKTLPQQLRHCHSMVHEAYGITAAIEHWQFYLIKQHFLVSTDNLPIANLFGQFWKYLNPVTQKQLIRLRSKISNFSFSSYHVEGLKNPIADNLSRYTLKLFETGIDTNGNRINVELAPIISADTKTPLLSRQEKETLDKINQESQILQQKLDEIHKDQNKLLNALMTNTWDVTPENSNTCYNNLNIDQCYERLHDSQNKDWNQTMREYKHGSIHLFKNKIQDLLNLSKDLLMQDESNLRNDDLKYLTNETINVCNIINKMDYSLRDNLREEMYHISEQQRQEQEWLFNSINVMDKEYNIRDELESDDEELIKSNRDPIITRSKSQSQTQPPNVDNNNNNEESKEDYDIDPEEIEGVEYKFTKINFENERDIYKTRHEFIKQIFGHRKDMDIDDIDKFREIQQSDNLLNLVTEMMFQSKDQWDYDNILLIQDLDIGLWNKLNNGELDIEGGLLITREIDERSGSLIGKFIVPFNIRGKLMDYAHHNLAAHHVNARQTELNLSSYWWSTMKKDIEIFCKQCISCQFTKGNMRARTPLVTRDLDAPLEHLYADFLGPVYGKYYVLVLVDAATGYVMLTPTDGCDALTVVNTILRKWIKTFGWFKTLETDWGSGFGNKLVRSLLKCAVVGKDNVRLELGEPRNHRSIGKVERIIGYLQNVINQYNGLLNFKLTDKIDDITEAWKTLETVIPMIESSFNQRRPRFTTFSPNMLIFGRNMNDISDIGRFESRLEKLRKHKEKDHQVGKRDYQYLSDLIYHMKNIREMFESDWKKYTWLSRKQYNSRHNITPQKIKRNRKKFKIGSKVLYFIGDKQVSRYKWRSRWTGPWTIYKIINDSTAIILDPQTGNQKRVTMDRLKIFNEIDFDKYENIITDPTYLDYQKMLQQQLSKHGIKFRESGFEADYTIKRNNYDN